VVRSEKEKVATNISADRDLLRPSIGGEENVSRACHWIQPTTRRRVPVKVPRCNRPSLRRAMQRQKIRGVIAREGAPRRDGAEFELQIGAAVPRRTELHDLPPEVAEAMSDIGTTSTCWSANTMVIVDRNSRRVAAIVPGAGLRSTRSGAVAAARGAAIKTPERRPVSAALAMT